MPKLRVHNFCISLDGYAAGPHQSREHPLGVGGDRLHEWHYPPRPATGPDDVDARFLAQGDSGLGATIMGRNMYGPVRGPWGDEPWTGWWGDSPPYHRPVFVLTHYSHPSIPMQGGTTFHFVADGIEAALARAVDAAQGLDVHLAGGADTIQQYLRAGLIDELHLVVVPVLLGGGTRLFDNLAGAPADYTCVEWVSSPSVMHVRLVRTPTYTVATLEPADSV